MTDVLEGGVYDHQFGTHVVNETGVSNADIYAAIAKTDRALLSSLQEWVQGTKMSYEAQAALQGTAGPGASQRNGGLFYRDRYLTPTSPFEQMRLAAQATEQDDIVGNVAETTESLAFSAVSMFMEDRDQQNVLNQWAADVELDARLREMWRQLFEVSQCYVATWWENKTYRVRGKTSEGGRSRRKEMTLRVPTRLTLLDPLKVVPVGPTIFGRDQLAWSATRAESKNFGDILSDDHQAQDEIVKRLIVGKYEPGEAERKELANMGIDVNNLWRLDPRYVFRHTLTRPGFQRFAPIRMRRVFELLDLKQQLRQMERAHIIGGPLRVDQRIATPDGWKPIGQAKVGDKVFSVDGKPTEIIGVYPQGVLSGMHRVTFTDGAEVVCDLKHPWTVLDRSGRERTIPLSLIIEEGLYDSNGPGKRTHRHRIPVAAPLELPEADLPLDPYLVGYMLGDGSFTQSIPKITCAEPEDDQPWRDALPLGVTVSQYETREGFCNQYGLKGSHWHLNEVTEGLRDAGLWGMSAADKYIPDAYLWASKDQRWALLQGLCDSDGHSHQAGGVEISTISPKLADGIVHLAQSLGGVAKISERAAKGNEQTCYRVWVSLHQQEAPFRIQRKVRRWQGRKVPYVRAFAKIESVEDAEAICIKTARDDGLFLTEGMVVTHNTNFIVLITKGTDEHPADPREVAHLQAQVRTVARVPVLVGDHRLKVEIVTPKLDQTLRAERFNTIDSRITATLYGMFMLGNYCLSEDTEILTVDGWKTHGQLEAGDVVLTANTETGLSEWQSCSAVNRFPWDDELVSYESRAMSALSTDNHRWWVRRKRGNGKPGHVWEFRTTEEMNDWCSVPLALPHAEHPVVAKFDDALVELVAWYWTEGTDKRDSAGVEISQSRAVNPQHCARIENALRGVAGGDWSMRERDGHVTYQVHAELGRELRRLAPDKVPSGDFLCNLTAAQLELFIARSIDADGHVDRWGKTMIAQKDERRIRAFEMACALAGIPTRTHHDGRLYRTTLKRLLFVNPLRSRRGPKAAATVKRVHYKGIVWCPTTPNGTWLARRNGTVYWTGNSAGASGDDSAKLTKVVARGMESRRHMLRRTLEANIFRPMYEGNDELESVPKLTYHPRAIALDFDANWADFLLRLREENELSRETILSQFDLDQGHEALLRKREQELYDDTFQTQVPFSSPNPVNEPGDPAQQRPLPRDNGGGRRNGGGRAPGSGQGQPPRSPSNRSDRGRDVPPMENMTLSITDADGKVVATVPMSAIQALAAEAINEGDDHGVEPEGQ